MHAQSMVKHISLIPRFSRMERENEPGDEAILYAHLALVIATWGGGGCTGVRHMALIDWKAASDSVDDVSHYTPDLLENT